MTTIFADAFDSPAFWTLGAGWSWLLAENGGALRVSVDDVPWLALLDPVPLPPGSIALRADVPQPLLVDDFTLAVPGFAPSATAAPVPGMTTDAALPLLLDEDFATPNPAPRVFDVLPAYTSTANGGLLRLVDGSQPLLYAQGNLVDAAVEADVALASGTLTLMVRRSADGHNRVDLSATGRLDLYHGDQWLQSAQVTPWAAGQPVRLGLSAVGAQVVVRVNGAPLISVQDAAPLPSGMVLLGVTGGQAEVTRVRIAGTVGAPREVAVAAAPRQPLAQPERDSAQSLASAPGGGQIVAALGGASSYSYNIFLLDSQGTVFNQLTFDTNAYNIDPSLSTDGTQVVYVSDRSGGNELYVVSLITGVTTRLTFSSEGELSPDWSPDGTHIVYTTGSTVRVLLRDTGATTTILSTGGGSAVLDAPRWSPNGQWIAYVQMQPVRSLHLMTPTGAYIRNITSTVVEDVASDFAWSPSSTEVVYCSYSRVSTVTNAIPATIRVDGSYTRRELNMDRCGPSLGWSPDGSTIAHNWYGAPTETYNLNFVPALGGPMTSTTVTVVGVVQPLIHSLDWGVIPPGGGGCTAGALSSERVNPAAPSCTIQFTPVPPSACVVSAGSSGINVRALPAADAPVLTSIIPQTQVNVLGITESGEWYRVQRRDNGITGFSLAAAFDPNPLMGQCSNLPIFGNSGTPFPTNTPTATATATATLDPNITPSATATPTLTPTYITRIVETQAVPFHQNAARFGLPAPFTLWPVVEADIYQNGYGPNGFSEVVNCHLAPVPTATSSLGTVTPTAIPDLCPYRGVNNIHPGVDYYTSPRGSNLVALCDGIIVPGRREPSAGAFGGSAAGWGLSLRCFANDPADPDGDGKRNLSNIIVVYNHIVRQDEFVERPPGDGAYPIIYAGQVLAVSGDSGSPGNTHLDLQVYIADGWRTLSAIQLNPRMMEIRGNRVDMQGIPRIYAEQIPYPGSYNHWTIQGRQEDGRGSTVSFWTNPSSSIFLYDVNLYLAQERYPEGGVYTGPNCINLASNVLINAALQRSIPDCHIPGPGGLNDS